MQIPRPSVEMSFRWQNRAEFPALFSKSLHSSGAGEERSIFYPVIATLGPSLKAFWTDLLPWGIAILQETEHMKENPTHKHINKEWSLPSDLIP